MSLNRLYRPQGELPYLTAAVPVPQLSSGTPQTFMGSMTFTGHVTVRGNIELGGQLNGFNTSQIVALGTDNNVLGMERERMGCGGEGRQRKGGRWRWRGNELKRDIGGRWMK